MPAPIWSSTYLRNPNNQCYFGFPETAGSNDRQARLVTDVCKGRKTNLTSLPDRLIQRPDTRRCKPRPVMSIDILMVNDAVRAAMAGGERGATVFHPVTLHDVPDGPPIHAGHYHLLLMQEQRPMIDRERGVTERWIRASPTFVTVPYGTISRPLDEIAGLILPGFEPDLDIWCDGYVHEYLFFSDRFKRMIEAAGFAKPFDFVRIR